MTLHSSDRHAQAPRKTGFICITGGVVSSLGKGIAAASLGRLLVARGDVVTRGQVIAYSGQTGDVSSPQLHFEIRSATMPVDPRAYLSAKTASN